MRYKKPIWSVILIITFLSIGQAFKLLPEPILQSLSNASHLFSFDKKENTTLLTPDFTKLVEQYGAAVVNIQVHHYASSTSEVPRGELTTLPDNDPLLDFFGYFAPPKRPVDKDFVSYGSGFLISQDGYLLTSAHLVNQAEDIKITLTDKREFFAELIGLDQYTDVALLKIKADHLPTVKIGNPNTIRVGEWVVAIGSPFQFNNTVTAGIVSAIRRNLPQDNFVPFIQSDVAINVGNSGGALFNLNGQVIGINSKIYSHSGEFSGIAFAIPIDIAMHVAEQIKKTGRIVHSQLGIQIQLVTAGLAKAFRLDRPRGALVVNLTQQSSAYQSGLQIGDVVLSINHYAIELHSDLPAILGKLAPHQKVLLEIWRQGMKKKLAIKLDPLDIQPIHTHAFIKKIPHVISPNKRLEALGITLSPLNDQAREQRHMSQGGLLVQRVEGLATKAGLLRGDIIIGLNQHPITSITQLRIALAKTNDNIALLIQRSSMKLFIPISFNETH